MVLRLVLAEDSFLMREGIRALLALDDELDLVAGCESYDELLAAVEEHQPDVVITDIRMPPTHSDEGIRAANVIRRAHPEIGVVVLSQYVEPEYAIRLFEEGSDGRAYLLKERVADLNELGAAIRRVSEGGSVVDPRVVDALIAGRAKEKDSIPDIQHEPKMTESSATFTQTTGGRTGAPLPRRLNRPPFLKITAPTVWTTLSLTIRADGSHEFEVAGASKMPRHWIYDDGLDLVAKSGMIDFKGWTQESFGDNTPWGDSDSPVIVTEVETELERQLSLQIMRDGKKPKIRRLAESETLVDQGDVGNELFLLLDGVLVVEVDGEAVAEVGPGSILGERALVEGGNRTSTLRALTSAKVAVARAPDIQPRALKQLAAGHRREEG